MMNMKKLLALLLAAVMVLGMFPMGVLADDEVLYVEQNGGKVSSVEFPSNRTAYISAKTAGQASEYQWQILVPGRDEWVAIYGEQEDCIKLSYAMVGNMMNDSGVAYVRCAATVNGEQVETKKIAISVGEAEHPEVKVPEYVPVAAPVNQSEVDAESAMDEAIAKQDVADAAYDAYDTAKKTASEAAAIAEAAETAAVTAETVAQEKKAAYEAFPPVEEGAEASEEQLAAAAEWESAVAAAEEARSAANAAADAKAAADVAVNEALAKYEAAQAEADAAAELAMSYGGGISTYGARIAVPATYTVTINYLFEDGTAAAESWHGQFNGGTSYNLEVESPQVAGYVCDISNITETLTFSGDMPLNKVYKVTYTPTNVNYKVEHWHQNVNDDGYVRVDSATKTYSALTNTPVGSSYDGEAYATEYTGFKALDYDTTLAVAADGSTVLKIYYDRLYYLMSFDLGDEGYGVDPIYARYGTPLSIPNPSRPGYIFNGWSPANPDATMPATDKTYTANWTTGNSVNVNLVFWYENANDNNYTSVGSATTTTAYTAGKTVKPSDFQNVSFTGRDNIHFNFNTSKNTAVALNADGSTIVNIYFTRKTYRMIFFNCRICATNEDTDKCYPASRADAISFVNKNVTGDGEEMKHDSGSKKWWISVYTRKWQENVREDWENGIAGCSSQRRWMPYEVKGDSGNLIYNGSLNVSTMNVMPDADLVFRFISEGATTCTMNYWVEPIVIGQIPSGTENKTDNNVKYQLHDKVVTKMGGITEKEEYVDIEGFTKVYTWQQLSDKGYRTSDTGWATAHFFYKRNSYKLTYINNGVTAKTVNVRFEDLLKNGDKNNFNAAPAYPSNYAPGAYKFDGWYLAENCANGTKVDWNKEKMPVGGKSVYAKWVPATWTVKTTGEGIIEQNFTAQHGNTVANPPATPTREGYDFISWFYKDANGKEVPFTFDMPITQNLNLYPKWKAAEIVDGMLYFKLKDTNTNVAEPQHIESLIGETKTYSAKTVDELFDAYKEGYFPEEVSHNITFVNDAAQNVWTFEYVQKDRVPYIVRYLEEGTNKELATAKTVSDNIMASVVEIFQPIAGYLPDLYKKQLLLSANGTNELIFWYTKDAARAPILRGHYLEEPDNTQNTYITYQETWDGYGTIGETYTEAPLTSFEGTDINGFTLNVAKSTQSGILTASGLQLKLYYDRNLYPYEFRFVDQDGKTIHDPIVGTAKFESTVTQNALVIPGYTLREMEPSQDQQAITIAIESGSTAVNNVKTFIYDAAYASMTINKTVSGAVEPDQTFVFHVHGNPSRNGVAEFDMYVTIDGEGGSTTLNQLPVGKYTVTELDSWSWRYELDGTAKAQDVNLNDPKVIEQVNFANKFTNNKWLSCEAYADNEFGALSGR